MNGKNIYYIIGPMILFILLCIGTCQTKAQEIIINDFSGGLNTNAGLFHMEPNQARECLNWDLSDETGALRVRNGYTDYGYKNDTNSLKFIYTHYYRDGRKELFGISKSDTASWGTLYRSGDKNNTLDTGIYDFLYTGAQWSAVSWKDKVVFANGYQRPLIWDGNRCKSLSIPSPGVMDAAPLNGTGNLNGEYLYLIFFRWYPNSLLHQPYTSSFTPRIKVSNNNIILFHFPIPQPDSVWPDTFSGDWDIDTTTIDFVIMRTKAIQNNNTDSIPFYPIRYYDATADTGYFSMPISALDTFKWVDSIGDTWLGDSVGFTNSNRLWQLNLGMTSPTIFVRRIGTPNFMERITCTGDRKHKVNPDTLANGDNVVKILYMTTYFDSTNTIESDSGRAFAIVPATPDDTLYYRLSIPPPPPHDSGLQRILYKALAVQHIIYGDSDNVAQGYLYPVYQILAPAKRENVIGYDTIITPFYQIAVIGNKDSIYYTDSTIWDSVSTRAIQYVDKAAPFGMSTPVVVGDKMWAYQGSKVMSSYLDSVGYWGKWDYYAFNLDDGDEGTALVPDRDYLYFYKNKSQYGLTRQSDGSYTTGWTVRGRGCVAPKSVQFYDGGIIYLDENGVYYETAIPTKDKGTQRNSLSAPIANLIDYPVSQLKEATSFLYNDKYMLSFPTKDTTYVYDFKVGAWSIYNFAFEAAINYDTISNAGLVPSSNMLFITGEDSVIYRFDTTHFDNGRAILAKWKSGPLAKSTRNVQIEKLGFWLDGPDSLTFTLRDHRDSAQIDSASIITSDNYYERGLKPNEGNYFFLGLSNLYPVPGPADTTGQLEVNEIDIYIKPGTAENTH